MDSLLEGCRGVSEIRVTFDWQFCDLLRACGERWVVLLIPGSRSQHKADLPCETCYSPIPKEVRGPCAIWVCVVTDSLAQLAPSPVQKVELEGALFLFLTSPLRKAFSTEAFLPISVRVFLLWVEGKCLLPKSSCIFNPTNSLHKQEGT